MSVYFTYSKHASFCAQRGKMSSSSNGTFDMTFEINGETIQFHVPIDSSDVLYKMTNDDSYAVYYIKELINNGFISLVEPLQSIKRIDQEGEVLIYGVQEAHEESDGSQVAVLNSNKSNEWTESETVMLLDLYEQYLPLVGPQKKFKTKKNMWNKIAEILNETFNTNKSGTQTENRYKTILKRKKTAVDNNNKSGATRAEIPYENELNRIASIDDSIEPEVIGTAGGIKIIKNKQPNDDCSAASTSSNDHNPSVTPRSALKAKRKVKTIQETLLEIHEKKEEARERRHQEKLDLLKKLFDKD